MIGATEQQLDDNADKVSAPQQSHRRALSGVMLDRPASSDESQDDGMDEFDPGELHDARPFIGISISAEQTRLASDATPAAEKAAAIGNDPFEDALKNYSYVEEPDIETGFEDASGSYRSRPSTAKSSFAVPSAAPSQQGRRHENSITSVLRNAVSGRPRASSGSLGENSERNQKKLLPISLPAFPKFMGSNRLSMPAVDSAISWLRQSNSSTADDTKQVFTTPTGRAMNTEAKFMETPDSQRPPPPLRRSTSDGSLYLLRAQSHASSLGDDSRWENIQEQVNSRAKAIRDSFVDANIRIPRFKSPWHEYNPSSRSAMSSTSVSVTTETRDFGYPRNGASERLPSSRRVGPKTGGFGPAKDGLNTSIGDSHPEFSRALKKLTGDLVILGGYRGSILRSAEPPHRQLWVPIKVGLGVRKVNLEVGLEAEADENMTNTIFPSGMLKHIGPVDISRRLFKRLRFSENARNGTLRIWDYGYDWRLSPELLSRQLRQFLENLPSNKSTQAGHQKGPLVICHSLGGLIVRHALNTALKADQHLVAGVIYAGVPQTCVNILGPLRNGDDVLFSSKVLTAQVNFSIRTSFALLPLDGKCFVDRETKEEYPLDFFDPRTWEEYRLSPCCAPALPPMEHEEPSGMIDQLMNSVTNVLPTSVIRKSIVKEPIKPNAGPEKELKSRPLASQPIAPKIEEGHNRVERNLDDDVTAAKVSIKKEDAMDYLRRTLSEVKKFKEELAFDANLTEKYPPAAVMYGKSIPTVVGAKVRGREGIKCADAYDDLAFASGDGVVLARAAQIPDGYRVVKGGVVSSDRGHISLLGDLEAVGRCVNAIHAEQNRRHKARSMANWNHQYAES